MTLLQIAARVSLNKSHQKKELSKGKKKKEKDEMGQEKGFDYL